MQSIDDRYAYLAEQAEAQCREIIEAFERIDDPENPSVEPETLRGIGRVPYQKTDRPALVFQSDETLRQRTLVFVDAILDLAALIQRERLLEEPARYRVPGDGMP
jgi:hypothetical protein